MMRSTKCYVALDEREHFAFFYPGDRELDLHHTCLTPVQLAIYRLNDEETEAVLEEVEKPKPQCRVATVYGTIIHRSMMLRFGWDPYMVCDDESGDLEYLYACLQQDGILTDADPESDLFYLDRFEIAESVKNPHKMAWNLLPLLRDLLLSEYNVYPRLIGYIPETMEDEEDEETRLDVYESNPQAQKDLENIRQALGIPEGMLPFDRMDEVNYFLGRTPKIQKAPKLKQTQELELLLENGYCIGKNTGIVYDDVLLHKKHEKFVREWEGEEDDEDDYEEIEENHGMNPETDESDPWDESELPF